ncbi:hypothetical protein D3C78_1072410 [compost metagenome]
MGCTFFNLCNSVDYGGSFIKHDCTRNHLAYRASAEMSGLRCVARFLNARANRNHLRVGYRPIALKQSLGIAGGITLVHLADNPFYGPIGKNDRLPLGEIRCCCSKLMNRSDLHLRACSRKDLNHTVMQCLDIIPARYTMIHINDLAVAPGHN